MKKIRNNTSSIARLFNKLLGFYNTVKMRKFRIGFSEDSGLGGYEYEGKIWFYMK